ncbi:MAG: class I SAM-dependent methyltransferase [Herbinix sp.]|nr:class I SAM-dependent methyltransferase [Herbinix sp.]
MAFKLPFQNLIGFNEKVYIQRIRICDKCGFIFTENPLTQEQLSIRYKEYSKYEFDDENHILQESEEYQARSYRQKQLIERNCNDIESIFEVGAASGFNLGLYKGIKRYGVEPSAVNCKLAKKYYSVEMFNGVFEEYINMPQNEKYDMVFLSHTLEHIVDPYAFIRQCSRINNKYVFIEVPTIDYKNIKAPFDLFCDEHVNYFSLQGLTSLMNKAGYSIVDCNMVFEPKQTLPAGLPAISTIWEKKDSISVYQYPMIQTKDLLKAYIKLNKAAFGPVNRIIDIIPSDERLAIWGAGNHASILLANTNLKNKNIVKIYDSDVKKQRVFKMCGLPISAYKEDDVINGSVEGILIATYSGQKAITKILEKSGANCKIYVLYNI